MTKTKNILLPTDFSENSRNAIQYAIKLFEKVDCRFYVLNAFQVSTSGLSNTMNMAKDTRLYKIVKEESERNITAIVKVLETNNKNPLHSFEGLSLYEPLLDAIGRTTIDKNIYYIIMGTKGSSAIKEVFMGSSTVKVLKHIDFCPIIAVPENYRFKQFQEIAFATNFEHTYLEAELVPLIEMAKLWNADISVVHVDTGKELSTTQLNHRTLLKKRFGSVPVDFKEIEGSTKISMAIRQYAEENEKIGLISMVNYWHSFFEKLTHEAVVQKVTFSTKVPFLILPLIE
ncbi:MAG: universal stress protein [Flavobacteriaceae bacterium]